MELHLVGSLALAFVLCACSVSALPASSSRQGEISELVSLLGKLKDIERLRQQQQHQFQLSVLPGIALSSRHKKPSSSSSSSAFSAGHTLKSLASEVRALSSPDARDPLLGIDLDLVDDAPSRVKAGSGDLGTGKAKRQGAWSYDYGLGGGRFGKRSVDEYGPGSGRYGRDVDHVDISDSSDADAASL